MPGQHYSARNYKILPELGFFVHFMCIPVYLTSKTVDSLKTPFPVLSKV